MESKDRVAARPGRPMPASIENAFSIAVVAGDSEQTVRTKRLIAGALWAGLFLTPISIVQMLVFDAPLAALVVSITFLSVVVALIAIWRWPAGYPGVVHALVGVNILVAASLVVIFGGVLASGVNMVWGLIVVLGAVAVFADRRSILWLAVYLVASVVSAVWAHRVEPLYVLDQAEYLGWFNLTVVSVFVFGLLYYYVRQRAILLDQSDTLLRNVLPDEIAARLKSTPGKIAESFPEASVLFADVAGFTPMSAEMSADELVSLLDEVFSVFDGMVAALGLEKIKTIGDAYMVAAGVPVPRADHALAICDLALAMRDRTAAREFAGRRLRFRIGINSGPVVAGIIGSHKFSYDLWGDAVNTASRMESSGVAGEIQITEATMRMVEAEFVCEPHGVVEVKGKGPMPVWFLRGRR